MGEGERKEERERCGEERGRGQNGRERKERVVREGGERMEKEWEGKREEGIGREENGRERK